MPNGGILQSCFVCKWSEKDKDIEKAGKQVHCQHHSIEIDNPFFTFCSDLSLFNEHGQPGRLVTEHNLIGQDVYTWVELGYTTKEYPGLPQYYHEFALLAPIRVYAEWSKEQRRDAVRAIYERKEKEFREKYRVESSQNSDTSNRSVHRILSWLRKLFP
jgi:hypothetical protein